MVKLNISGKLEVQAFGSYIEPYMTEIMARGIKIWDIKNENGIICFSCLRTKYKIIAETARNYRVKVNILKRDGLYFKLRPYLKRYGIGIGIAGYFLTILIMSNFIWDIKIIGNTTISDNQIKEILSLKGVNIGALRNSYDKESVELAVLLELDSLAWINVERMGSRVSVKLNERLTDDLNQEMSEKTPCNITASNSGVITDTEVYRGKLLLQKGSGVNKGDIIVSGTVDDGAGNILMQHADAKIMAECEDVTEFFVPFNSEELKKSGEVIEKKHLIFLGNTFNLFLDNSIPISHRYMEEINVVKFLWFNTPFKLKKGIYEELESVEVTYSNAMAIQKLDEKIEAYKMNFFKNSEIINSNVEYYPSDDGIKAVLKIKYLTDIAKKEEINIR